MLSSEIKEVYEAEVKRNCNEGVNVSAIAETYYDYHGCPDDGTSIADEVMTEVGV